VEPQTENVSVGSHLPGIVAEVYVWVGDKVKPGAKLFRLDDRQLRSEERVREALLTSAQATLARSKTNARAEERQATTARLKEAEANHVDQKDQFERAERLFSSRAIGDEEFIRRRQAFEVVKQQLNKARADMDAERVKDEAHQRDVTVAEAAVKQTEAQLAQTRIELERLVVCAPVSRSYLANIPAPDQWEVLQVNVRPGEFVGVPPGQALLVLGNVEQLHVRIDIDENDIARFKPGVVGTARLRGDAKQTFPIKFVRVEPYVIPKKSLTGASSERVDTRVLQVIYRIEPSERRLYVGQQLDVFLQLEPEPTNTSAGS
jgi:multidrug resistance efflux pump